MARTGREAGRQNIQRLNEGADDLKNVEDTRNVLARSTQEKTGRGSERVPQSDEEGNALFGTPEAVATALFGSLILGPVGGVLLGGAQGWLKKNSDQAILDQLADERNVLTKAGDVYTERLGVLKAGATNDNDLEQVADMEGRVTAAKEFMLSADDKMQAHGVAMLASVDQDMSEYTIRQETQLIAAEAEEARQRVELDDRQFSRFTGMQSDFTNESAGYLAVSQSVNTALAALQSGTPADLHAAVVLVNKALDPESVVRAEEARAFGNMGSRFEKTANLILNEFTGATLTANQRRELGGLLMSIKDESTRFQLSREGRFSDQVIDADLPNKYHDNFRLVENVPSSITLDIQADALDKTRATAAAVTGAIADAPEAVRSAFEEFVNTDRGEAETIGAAFDLLNPTRPGARLPTN